MNFIKPLTILGLALQLCACGGGDSGSTKAASGSVALTVSAPVWTTTPRGGVAFTFGGGACGGGNGEYTALWSYGDGSASTIDRTHTYPVSATTQFYQITVTCTDTASDPAASITLPVSVDP